MPSVQRVNTRYCRCLRRRNYQDLLKTFIAPSKSNHFWRVGYVVIEFCPWCGKRLPPGFPLRGFVSFLILVFLTCMSLMMGVMLDRSLTGLKASQLGAAKAEAFQAAEAGVHDVMSTIQQGTSTDLHCNSHYDNQMSQTAAYSVTIDCLPERIRVLTATGTVTQPETVPVSETIQVTYRLWLAPPGKPVILEQVAWQMG